MTITLDGTSGLTTPGVVNTAGETIATTLAVTGASTLTGAVTASTTLAVTGVSTFAAGTALLPALTTTGDTNTGLWFPAADTVAASTGGTERMRIDSAGLLKFNSGYGSVATAYGCRAWVNFNGTGTVAIRASGNVSSITDNGTGDYTVNFTTAMVDANYAITGTTGNADVVNRYRNISVRGQATTLVGSVRVETGYSNTSAVDGDPVSVAIFR